MTTLRQAAEANLEKLNRREAKPVFIARLMTEACGKSHHVSLTEALEFRRDQYGLSAKDFSMLIGLSQSHYSEVIHGIKDLPIKSVKRAYALGVPPEILLSPSPLRGEI